jgi:predicted amidohydrolase YtcJ
MSTTKVSAMSFQDLSRSFEFLPSITIYKAKEIITLNPAKPHATAVAVLGDRILAVGSVEELEAAAGGQPYVVDETFANHVIVPGLIAQHDHPLLSSLSMMSEIIAIEDWVLPTGTIPAAKNEAEYRKRLAEAEAKLKDPNEVLVSWGYHQTWHGKLNRAELDKISRTRPIIVWHRSVHEFIVNTRALETYGIDEAFVAAMPESAQAQSSLEDGHFFEQGLFAVVPKLLPAIATPERLRRGPEFMVQYYHANGVTIGCEPGGLYSKQLQDAQNAVLSSPTTPFRFYFIPDGKSLMAMFPETAIAETEKVLTWGKGMTVMMPKQIKLFADGAVYSLLMQLREPFHDGTQQGAWIMGPDFFAKAFQVYWDAGYQIHIHVTGDAGVDLVLDNLELNMRRNPRYDHRTVVVHFPVSAPDQVERIKRLGAIVSGNPYYVTALADKYSDVQGPERADQMSRMGDVERAGISYSFHADMPMAPGQPLFLMHCGVNRITTSGRVAGANQRVSREGALKAVTLEAALSLGLEKEVGNIVAGKLANFTILEDNPVTCDPKKIKDIAVWGTIHEGRVLPVTQFAGNTQTALGPVVNELTIAAASMAHQHDDHADHSLAGCVCTVNRIFGLVFGGLELSGAGI